MKTNDPRQHQLTGLALTARRDPTEANVRELANTALTYGLLNATDAALVICWLTARVRDLTLEDLRELGEACEAEVRRRGRVRGQTV